MSDLPPKRDRPFEITPQSAGDVCRGLARAPNGQWFHVSPRGDQVILRGLSTPTTEKHSLAGVGEERRGYTFVPYEALRWYLERGDTPPGKVSHKETAFWCELAARFDADPELCNPSSAPTTDLRNHYDDLRVRGRAATPVSAGHLAGMFASAVGQLATYRNLREGWMGEGTRKPSDDDTFARSVARQLDDGELVAPWEYVFVARELAPLRTTMTDARSSGAGGIDVLLASDDDDQPLPIIVEVKSVSDVGAYLGLVQALTYASELITPHQRRRLARFYPDHFERLADTPGPFADIWIVVERGKQDPEHAPTRELAQAFLRDAAVSTLLRRIAFLELDPQTGQLVPA